MNKTFITIKKELRTALRDKRSLTIMILMPLIIPVFIFAMAALYDFMGEEAENEIYQIGINYKLNDIEENILKDSNIEYTKFNNETELRENFDSGKIDAYIVKTSDVYKIYFNEKSDDSFYAGFAINNYLDEYNTYLGQQYLNQNNIELDKVYENIKSEVINIEGENSTLKYFIMISFIYSIMIITITAINSATDITAGEKERGTLETILTFPLERNSIVFGKYISVSIVCVISSVLSMLLAYGSLFTSTKIFNVLVDANLNISFSALLLSLLIMFVYSFLISGLTIAIASYSKTYKEAQSALSPLSFLVMIPMFLCIADIPMSMLISFIPIVNHSMILNEIVNGTATISQVLIVFSTTFIYIYVILYFISKQYKTEKVLFAN